MRPQRVALEDHRHLALLGRQRARAARTPAGRRHGSRRRRVPGNPAISRSVVVLPQPDGPSRQTSCPWSIRSETLSTTASDPNRLVRSRNSTDANRLTPCILLRVSAPGSTFAGYARGAVVGRCIYRTINISTNAAGRKARPSPQALTLSPSHRSRLRCRPCRAGYRAR